MSKHKNRRDLVIYCDGASRGNPGPAALGGVILEDGVQVKTFSRYLGDEVTNNQAEYLAVIESLKEALREGATHVLVRVDSQLVQRQLLGRYRVKNPVLQGLWSCIAELVGDFDEVDFEHVPREQNALADQLANEALDELAEDRARSVLSSSGG